MKGRLIVVALAFAFSSMLAGCGAGLTATPVPPPQPTFTAAPKPTPTAEVNNPEAVLRAIAGALNEKDVEAATALLADDVTQTLIPSPSGTGVYKGKDAMRARFKEVVALNANHNFGKCAQSGNQVTCLVTYSDDSTKPLGFDLEMKAEAVVQNGLLKSVTWTLSGESLGKMQAAMAAAQPQAISLTFTREKCAFAGPMRIPVGENSVNIKVEGDGDYGLFIATFDKGKTLDDLKGLPVVSPPDWVHEVDKVEFSSGRKMVTKVTQGPIYLICFDLTGAWKVTGAFGPIDVGK